MRPSSVTDEDVGPGDVVAPASFEELARDLLPALLRYATALTADPHTGADVVQEVMVRAHSRWGRIRRTDRPDLYLRRMVTNEHLSWRRRWDTRSVLATPDETLHRRAPQVPDTADGVADRDDLRHRLDALPPRQRVVVVLRYYEGLDDAEIAAVLRVTTSTVRSTVARALASMRVDAAAEAR